MQRLDEWQGRAEEDRGTVWAQSIQEGLSTYLGIQGPMGALQHHLVQPELQGVHLKIYWRCCVVEIESAMQSEIPAPGRVQV